MRTALNARRYATHLPTFTDVMKNDNMSGMEMQAFNNFRANVSAIMLDRGLSQREFAPQIGASHSYISNVLSGKICPSLDRCQEIADALGVSLSKLIAPSRKKTHAM